LVTDQKLIFNSVVKYSLQMQQQSFVTQFLHANMAPLTIQKGWSGVC